MAEELLPLNNIFVPRVLVAEKHFLLVYKPPRMHSAPLSESKGANILDYCVKNHPEVLSFPGRKSGEGGLLHRLDYETQGLMLIARTKPGMESLLQQQNDGEIKKEYSALTAASKNILPGFPVQKPPVPLNFFDGKDEFFEPFRLTCAFRPYGQGGKTVRPVFPESGQGENPEKKCMKQYFTEILGRRFLSFGFTSFRLRIVSGFRHQIRSQMAWLGMPILNDKQYGAVSYGMGLLGLRACSLAFYDPASGEELCYSIPAFELDEV